MPTNFRYQKGVKDKIDQAIAEVRKRADLPDRSALLEVLTSARQRMDQTQDSDFGFGDEKHGDEGDDFALSIVLSALEATPPARAGAPPAAELFLGRKKSPLGAAERIVGSPPYSVYSDLDPRWLGALANVIKSTPQPFPARTSDQIDQSGSGIITLKDKATIALAGDWGTGNSSSVSIAKLIAKRNPDYTIHLGDVYYAGTPEEVQTKFIDIWPSGSAGTFALNSNHEMYSGGAGYFGLTLKNPRFAKQGGLSYFLLQNDNWAIFGLDTAYHAARASLYMNGRLDQTQIDFLHEYGVKALEAQKQLILLTHHEGRECNGFDADPLWSQVGKALDRTGVCYWFWGHVHGAAVFEPKTFDTSTGPLEFKGRLVGHGGIPFGAIDRDPNILQWSEDQLFGHDHDFPKRALNGFAFLHIDGKNLTEELWSENDTKRWSTIGA